MKNLMQWFKREQPISLKWKWGVLLFSGFFIVSVLGLFIYHHHFKHEQREAMGIVYQEDFNSIVNYLQSFEEIYALQTNQMTNQQISDMEHLENLLPEVYNFLDTHANEAVILRLFNTNNQLVYSSRHIVVPNIKANKQMNVYEVEEKMSLVASAPIYAQISGKLLGTLQYIVYSDTFAQREKDQLMTFFKALMLLTLISAILAWFVSQQFLRPLNYLNNALDLVEEESLSELRMRKPKSVDEWSDLTLHINRMLDKIDLYVKNQKQFVEDVSHELRTPVAIVEGHLTMLNRWGKDDPEILEESIQASLQEISRMKGLVQEMLDLMRADHAEIDYKDEITEIFTTTRQVYNNFVMLYPEFQFYLDADKNADDLYIRMFRNHFEQVLIILMDNAVKYSTDRKEIHVSVSINFSDIEIAVQDFGEGMTEDDKQRVFGRFYRVDKARSRDKGGNGLGLSIAQQLIQSYKGSIRVESVLGQGSIFYVSYPILTDTRQIYKSKQIAMEKNL